MGEFKAAMPDGCRAASSTWPISIAAIARHRLHRLGHRDEHLAGTSTNATPTLGIPFWIFLGATLFGFAGAALVHLVHLRKPPQADTNIAV